MISIKQVSVEVYRDTYRIVDQARYTALVNSPPQKLLPAPVEQPEELCESGSILLVTW